MKIKYEFVYSEVEDETVAVSVGTEERNIIISLNESALFLWKLLTEVTSSEALATALMDSYDGLDRETACAEVNDFLQMLRENGLLDE